MLVAGRPDDFPDALKEGGAHGVFRGERPNRSNWQEEYSHAQNEAYRTERHYWALQDGGSRQATEEHFYRPADQSDEEAGPLT